MRFFNIKDIWISFRFFPEGIILLIFLHSHFFTLNIVGYTQNIHKGKKYQKFVCSLARINSGIFFIYVYVRLWHMCVYVILFPPKLKYAKYEQTSVYFIHFMCACVCVFSLFHPKFMIVIFQCNYFVTVFFWRENVMLSLNNWKNCGYMYEFHVQTKFSVENIKKFREVK